MKNTSLAVAAFLAVLVVSAGSAFAATFDLTNGGLGQAALNHQQFGVAVCDKNSQALTSVVPVVVTVAGKSVTVSSVAPIPAGQCKYTYVGYSQLGMQAGQTYSANVVVDPQHTAASNADNSVSYSVTVPAQVAANGSNLTANANSQLSNPLMTLWGWLTRTL